MFDRCLPLLHSSPSLVRVWNVATSAPSLLGLNALPLTKDNCWTTVPNQNTDWHGKNIRTTALGFASLHMCLPVKDKPIRIVVRKTLKHKRVYILWFIRQGGGEAKWTNKVHEIHIAHPWSCRFRINHGINGNRYDDELAWFWSINRLSRTVAGQFFFFLIPAVLHLTTKCFSSALWSRCTWWWSDDL